MKPSLLFLLSLILAIEAKISTPRSLHGGGQLDRAANLPPAGEMVAAHAGIIEGCTPEFIYSANRSDEGMVEHKGGSFTEFGAGLDRGKTARILQKESGSLMLGDERELLSKNAAADLLDWIQIAHRVTTTTTRTKASPSIGQRLTDDQVAQFAGLALKGIFQEYPNKPSNVIRGPAGIRSPREMHPVFYGCFDWHSSIHGHWMLVHLLRNYPNAPVASEIEEALEKQLQKEPLLKEVAYFDEKGNASFERMYGWAWALRLATELRTWDDPRAKRWADAFRPLEYKIVVLTEAYLPRLGWPIRTGVHPDTAFALGQSLDYARAVDNAALERLIVERTMAFYANDTKYPAAYEPSGEDFFSAGLNEADLMRRVLPQDNYIAWLDKFLPEFGNLFEPVEVTDVTDGKLVHLAGLNLSRGWTLNGIASALKKSDPKQQQIREAAAAHTKAGLGYVFSGHYEGDHWLATFAIYTLSQVGISR